MRLAGAAIVVGLLALAVVGTGAVRARQRAATSVASQAEPLLVGAEQIYSSLADADATATNTFLDAGLEPTGRRQVYVNDLTTATNQLAKVAAQAGTSTDAAHAVGVISKNLPVYSGLIEAARVNNRLGFPVGAAYLREASGLMQGTILPAVRQLFQVEATRLTGAYNSGVSLLDILGVLLAGAVALVLLVLTQGFLARRTNRVINPGLVAGTLVLVLLVAWTAVAFTASARRLTEARTRGSDPVQLLSTARILVARAQVDENLALVARGSGSQYLADFNAVTTALGPPGGAGLLDEAESSSEPGQTTQLTGTGGLYDVYLQAHAMVQKAVTSGQFTTAVQLATTDQAAAELPAASQLSDALNVRIQQAQGVFTTKSSAGAHDLSGLSAGVIGLVVLAAGLALFGLEQRISEYR
jgi:hypothetical protein